MEPNFITFSFYKAVLNNLQIKGPKGHPSITYLRIVQGGGGGTVVQMSRTPQRFPPF